MKRAPLKSRYRDTGPSDEVVRLVLDRDFRSCAVCGAPIRGARGWDWSVQHRLRRGGGGTRREFVNLPGNLIFGANDIEDIKAIRDAIVDGQPGWTALPGDDSAGGPA